MNRRCFLQAAGGACGAAAVLGLVGCAGFHYVNAVPQGSDLRVRRADVEARPYVLVEEPGRGLPILVRASGVGAFDALLLQCTHRSCALEVAPGRLICPCHGSEFSLAGHVLEGPADRPLERYPVTVGPDELVIHLGAA
jgi:Rieske Fe-S protein